jgi:hypothetical protein
VRRPSFDEIYVSLRRNDLLRARPFPEFHVNTYISDSRSVANRIHKEELKRAVWEFCGMGDGTRCELVQKLEASDESNTDTAMLPQSAP